MISKINKYKYEDLDKIYETISNNFNSLAKEKKLKIKSKVSTWGIVIIKPIIFNIGNAFGECEFYFDLENKLFRFYRYLDESIFNEIKIILEELNEDFIIDII